MSLVAMANGEGGAVVLGEGEEGRVGSAVVGGGSDSLGESFRYTVVGQGRIGYTSDKTGRYRNTMSNTIKA